MTTTSSQYSLGAIILHWLMAIMIILQLLGGIVMEDGVDEGWIDRAQLFELYQLHKSVGLTILALALVRIAWRLTYTPPPLPNDMRLYERWGAKLAHIGFYILIIAFPLSGWVMVSSSEWNVPTLWFGTFEWPHIGFIHDMANKKPINEASKEIHEIFATLTWVMLALHVTAALYHHFIRRDNVLTRMAPFLKQRAPK